MSIDTTLKTSNSSISVAQPAKPEKTCCSLYKIAKWVITAAFWVLPQQAATRPLERTSVLEAPSTPSLPSTPKNTSSEEGLELTLSREDSNALRAQRLMQRALKSKIITALYEEASEIPAAQDKSGPWSVIFTDTLDFEAECFPEERTIEIRSQISDDAALSILIFELVNAVQIPRFAKFKQLAMNNLISREGYAYNYERIEYRTVCLHRRILAAAISEMGWGMHLLSVHYKNPHEDMSFKDHLQRVEKSGHTDFYRRQWDRYRASASPT